MKNATADRDRQIRDLHAAGTDEVEIATRLQVGLPVVRRVLMPRPPRRRAAKIEGDRPKRRIAIIDGPSPIDLHVGKQVRLHRTVAGLSQTQLAEAIGLTFQQIQKYERGGNRISASKLVSIARVLGVPVTSFFEGLDGAESEATDGTIMLRREAIELSRAYERITSSDLRRSLMELFNRLGNELAPPARVRRRSAR